MNLPPFVYSLKFWEAVSLVVAILVAYYTDYKLEAAVVLGVILAVLRLLGVTPELRVRGYRAWFKK
jgi:hypothetical protein